MERATGIEPVFVAWEATFLPLEDARSSLTLRHYLIPLYRNERPAPATIVVAFAVRASAVALAAIM